jgi:hypothetical protein
MNRESSKHMYPYKEKTYPIVVQGPCHTGRDHLFDIVSIIADVENLKDVLRH